MYFYVYTMGERKQKKRKKKINTEYEYCRHKRNKNPSEVERAAKSSQLLHIQIILFLNKRVLYDKQPGT